ncbi:hypothetical protein [Cryobacterium sp.]|uniref:hypothetical protein n=1 Tax=Cryobacterium sp. TaxID=1926290 RepID=UPI00262383AC|nr:hypothetical protein [Cryobacterium sp.]
MQWWVIAGFGMIAAGTALQLGSLGALLLTLLFVGSIAFTENISMARHPGYAAYRRAVWPLVPWLPKRTPAPAPVYSGLSRPAGPEGRASWLRIPDATAATRRRPAPPSAAQYFQCR